jgi:hypothetical protein
MARNKEKSRQLFKFSLVYDFGYDSIVGYFVIFAVFLFLAILEVLSDDSLADRIVGDAWFVLIAAISLLGVFRLVSQRVRKGRFYEDHFVIEGKALDGRFDYTGIEQVSVAKLPLAKVFPAFGIRKQVHLRFKGENQDLVIPRNPSNLRLKTDLYSWLEERIQQK